MAVWTRRRFAHATFACPKVEQQIPPLRYPGFPVEVSGLFPCTSTQALAAVSRRATALDLRRCMPDDRTGTKAL
jgi:hypothetical protein